MIPEAREVHLSRKDRKVLEACCRSPVTLQRDLKRARIVLLAADGRSTRSIAKEVGGQPRIGSLWRHRYADQGLEGLQDKPRPGKQPIYTKTTDKGILKLLDKPPPQEVARWTCPLLFAALEVATGKIIATHSKRRRRVEFLDFMDSLTAAFPDRKLHVILDNLNTHKKNEDWLKAHPNVQFHFTPTSASWLNQVEVWLSILQGQSLSGASFTSLKQLQEHIDAYVNAYNDKAEPFVWTKKRSANADSKPAVS